MKMLRQFLLLSFMTISAVTLDASESPNSKKQKGSSPTEKNQDMLEDIIKETIANKLVKTESQSPKTNDNDSVHSLSPNHGTSKIPSPTSSFAPFKPANQSEISGQEKEAAALQKSEAATRKKTMLERQLIQDQAARDNENNKTDDQDELDDLRELEERRELEQKERRRKKAEKLLEEGQRKKAEKLLEEGQTVKQMDANHYHELEPHLKTLDASAALRCINILDNKHFLTQDQYSSLMKIYHEIHYVENYTESSVEYRSHETFDNDERNAVERFNDCVTTVQRDFNNLVKIPVNATKMLQNNIPYAINNMLNINNYGPRNFRPMLGNICLLSNYRLIWKQLQGLDYPSALQELYAEQNTSKISTSELTDSQEPAPATNQSSENAPQE